MDFWLQKLFIHDLFHSPSDAIATNVGCWIMHHIASPGGLGYSLHCGGNEQEQRCFRLVPSLHSGTNTTFLWRDGRNNGPVLAYQFETQLLSSLLFVCLISLWGERPWQRPQICCCLSSHSYHKTYNKLFSKIIDFTSVKHQLSPQQLTSFKRNLICKNLEAMDSILLPLGFIKVAVLGKALASVLGQRILSPLISDLWPIDLSGCHLCHQRAAWDVSQTVAWQNVGLWLGHLFFDGIRWKK